MERLLVILVVLVGCKPAPEPPDQNPNPPRLTLQEVVLSLHNDEREMPLELDEKLTAAAQDHADWMAERHRMTHSGNGGPGARITKAGYSWSTYGENVAWGQASPQEVMSVWMSSRGHRRNSKSGSSADLGVGVAESTSGQKYWCTTFGSTAYNGEEWSDSWSVSEHEE